MSQRIRVVIHFEDLVINQCATAGLRAGKGIDWFKDFMKKTHPCVSHDIDAALKLVLTHFEFHLE